MRNNLIALILIAGTLVAYFAVRTKTESGCYDNYSYAGDPVYRNSYSTDTGYYADYGGTPADTVVPEKDGGKR